MWNENRSCPVQFIHPPEDCTNRQSWLTLTWNFFDPHAAFRICMMDDQIVNSIVSWILRSSVIFLVLSIGFLKGRASRKARTLDDSRLNKQGMMPTAKPQFSSSENRPLFRILECSSEASVSVLGRVDVGPVFIRDSLLASRTCIQSSKPPQLNPLKYCQPESIIINRLDVTACERDSLQRLMQFKAFRTISTRGASWNEWNENAQKILRGSLLLNCKNISFEVYESLLSNGVLPDSDTFQLLVRGCLRASEYQEANHFLAKMAEAGYTPPSNLEQDFHEKKLDSMRLNKDAPVFVPKVTREA